MLHYQSDSSGIKWPSKKLFLIEIIGSSEKNVYSQYLLIYYFSPCKIPNSLSNAIVDLLQEYLIVSGTVL